MSEAIYIGATVKGAADAEQYFSAPKVPGNMSKPTTIGTHIEKVQQARSEHKNADACAFAGSVLGNDQKYENHVHRPVVGVLASVYILSSDREMLYQQAAKCPVSRGKVALPLVSFLKETFPQQFAANLRYSDATPEVIIFGFNIKQILRIAAFEVLGRNVGAKDTEQTALPVRLWHNPTGVYDLLDILLPAGDQRDLDLYSVLRYFGIDTSPRDLSVSAKVQAETLADLVARTQLIPASN